MSRYNRKERPKCLNCKKPVPRKPNKYCCGKCQMDYQYKQYIKRWLEGKETGNHKSNMQVSEHVKKWLKETRGEKCEKCNWNTINEFSGNVPVQMNHIDGNSLNTVPKNIELLCPNCHSLTPTYGNLNRGNGRKNRYKQTT